MTFSSEQRSDFNFLRSLEWIETNGIGGYASGTVSGAHSRRYHGLLVAAQHPPVGRMIMVSKLDETIITTTDQYELGSNQYAGAIHPRGYSYLTEFNRDLFPEFHYEVAGYHLKKTIAAIDGENVTVVLYEVLAAKDAFTFELLPLYAYRDFHAVARANNSIRQAYSFSKGVLQTINYNDCPGIFVTVPDSSFAESRCWYNNFEYSEEQERGLEFVEDLFTHGRFRIQLKAGNRLGVILSTEPQGEKDAFRLFEKEKKRREKIIANFTANESLKRLALAADQFVVKRDGFKAVIAGYHWFSDWGRDTMISLPGLCLVTQRFEDAKNILRVFANSVSEGMLPNRFPDYNEPPEYNTIDATLWYFLAIYHYYRYTEDKIFVQSLFPVLLDIIDRHEKGTRYQIKVDPADGLLSGGQDGVQLTWMDAKVGDWVVTPRKGKAVEINALWYNALCCLEFLCRQCGHPLPALEQKVATVLTSFNIAFWNEGAGYLYDVIDGERKDDTIRPNAIYAIGLPFSLLSGERAKQVIEKAEKELLTPKGLRSLSPSHPDYHPAYTGDRWQRDGAYHQGTVWSFLLGIYIDAFLRVNPDEKDKAAAILRNFLPHLDEAGVGTVSEIFDANAPHAPRGCIAQAWGVAEILRVAIEYDLIKTPNFQ